MAAAVDTGSQPSVSTTVVLALSALAAAIVVLPGEDGAFAGSAGTGALTVGAALFGLLPWALVAGGVRLPPWLFVALSVPPAVLVVTVANNPGGMFPLLVTVVWLTLRSPSLWPPAVTALAGFLALVECTIDQGSLDESGIVYFTAGLGISWLSGMLLRRQEALTAQVEAMRDQQVEQLAATERARIAREVHDVVAHSLTIVMLHLTGARRALAVDSERADEALARAEVVGRDSLDAIREVMGLLREPDGTSALPDASLDGIPRLIEGYRRAGLQVELTWRPTATCDPTVGLVVYRVVQQSLANVLQHAPGASATVSLVNADGGLDVTITNGPPVGMPPVATERVGLGTTGMGERVRAVGGTFESGATVDGGWRVTARVPVRRDVPVPHG